MAAVVAGGRPGGGDGRNAREGIGALPIRIGGGGAHAGAGEGSRALDGRWRLGPISARDGLRMGLAGPRRWEEVVGRRGTTGEVESAGTAAAG